MADVRISQLPAATSVASTDELPANQGGTTRKVTHEQLVSAVDARATSLANAISVVSQQISVLSQAQSALSDKVVSISAQIVSVEAHAVAASAAATSVDGRATSLANAVSVLSQQA